MSFHFHTIGLIGTHTNPLVGETVERTLQLLTRWGRTVIVETSSAQALSQSPAKTGDLKTLAEHCDLVIAVGGDGNLLNAARHLSLNEVPVLGINRGQLGFLTDVSPDLLELMLNPILNGEYVEGKRALLEGCIKRNGEIVGQGNALNDVVLFPGDIAQLIEFELRINGKFVYSQRSDGLIISTPTGSTAYSLSAGGPIISPQLNALVLVPKLPHTLTSRPLVIDADSVINLDLAEYNKVSPKLSFDGQHHFDLSLGDEIIIRKQANPLRLIHPQGYDYYHVLRTKLHWGTQLIPLSK
jgi:NAD+ kinase